MRDIKTGEDITLLVRTFYQTVQNDTLLSSFFSNLDMEKHIPVIVRFWESILLDKHSYTGNAFEKHIQFHLEKKHFDQWLVLFHQTVDDLFNGELAERAKQRATSIATIFQIKLTSIR